MAPTRSAVLECLFSEARRYYEKANVVDHVCDRMKFIDTGSIELPRSRGFNIGAVVEAARRIEFAAQFVGVRGREFADRLRQLARSILPDHRIPKSVETILAKVLSWTHRKPSRKRDDRRQSRTYEYGR